MNKVVLSCLESQFHVYDVRTFHPTKNYAGLTYRTNSGNQNFKPKTGKNAKNGGTTSNINSNNNNGGHNNNDSDSDGLNNNNNNNNNGSTMSGDGGGGCTVWGSRHLPQNRDVFVSLGGDGVASIYKYDITNTNTNDNDNNDNDNETRSINE